MRRVWLLIAASALSSVTAQAASDSEVIFAREAALSVAIARADAKALESLMTGDVRIVRSEDVTFYPQNVVIRLASLFGLAPGSKFSRSAETIQISQSGDFAFVTGTQHVTAPGGESISSGYLSIWRKMTEFDKEWGLSFDAPLVVWKSLNDLVSLDPVSHTPGLQVVRLAASEFAEQWDGSATFRQSKAKDLAYSIGSYMVPLSPDKPEERPIWGYFLTTWENDGSGWKLTHSSFPEPKATHSP